MPRKPRKPNEVWIYAKRMSEEMGSPQREVEFRRLVSLVKKQGVDLEIMYLCWKELISEGVDMGDGRRFKVEGATPYTVLKGGNPAIWQRFLSSVENNIPAVYDSNAYDEYFVRYATVLRKLGKTYQGWQSEQDQFSGRRLSYEVVEKLGLLSR